jgi:hypothetical protein
MPQSTIARAGNILVALGLATLSGGMLFFGTVMAPLVFANLPEPVAGPFLRAAFPMLYAFIIVTATIAACGYLILGRLNAAIVLFIIVAATYWLWFYQLPELDAFRAAHDTAAFNRGHEFSVWVYGGELLSAFALLIRFAIAA